MKTGHVVLAACVIVVILVSGFFVGTDLLNKPPASLEPAPTSNPPQTSSPNPTDNPASSTTSPSPSPNPTSSTNPTPTPTPTETAIPSPSPTASPTPSPSPSPTPTPPPPSLTLTSPNGGESLPLRSVQEITWIGSSAIDYVKLELYKGGVFSGIIADVAEDNGHFFWSVAPWLTPGGDYQVKITADAPSDVSDIGGYFSIIEEGTITVTSPNGGEYWARGAAHNIEWSFVGSVFYQVRIDLYKGGLLVREITDGTGTDGGFYDWVIPADITPGDDYRIRVTSVATSSISDSSNAIFRIAGVTVAAPNGGESWAMGSTKLISWSSGGVGLFMTAKIELFKGGVFVSEIVDSVGADDGYYQWTIPSNLGVGSDYRIRITSNSIPAVADSSDSDFAIVEAPSITVLNPNGGESWMRNAPHIIAWLRTGDTGDYVMIELLKGGATDRVIASNVASQYGGELIEYIWWINDYQQVGTDYSIRISSMSNPAVKDASDSNFEITLNAINVVTPNDGESWARGASHTIVWTSDEYVYNVDILLFKGGVFHSYIVSGMHNDGSYVWSIPSTFALGTDYQIEVTCTSMPWVDSSDSYFTISGINVISPNGGEKLARNSLQSITWLSVGSVGSSVKIELLQGTTSYVLVESTPNDGSYSGVIPILAPVGTNYKIRITSTTYPTISDTSDGYFAIT